MKRKDIYTLLFGILCCAGTSLCFSCADDLEIGKQFDECGRQTDDRKHAGKRQNTPQLKEVSGIDQQQ